MLIEESKLSLLTLFKVLIIYNFNLADVIA